MPNLILNGNKIAVRRTSRRLVLRRLDAEDFRKEKLSISLDEIERSTVIGHPNVPVSILQRLLREQIPVSFISEKGHWYGTLHPDRDRNAARRIQQYQHYANPAARLACATALVQTKIRNQRRVLQRLGANRPATRNKEYQSTLISLRQLAQQATTADGLPRLRGFEGLAAAHYFQCLERFFPENTPFNGRSRRPPKDAANALLSWTYAIVLSEVDTALRIQGLDPCIGWLHEISDGRSSLALDLLEPLRAPVCDLLVLNLLNHGILTEKQFETHPDDGGTYLSETARKTFFSHYETHMQRKFKLPGETAHTDLRRCITQQVWGVLHLLKNQENPRKEFFQMP